MRIIAGSKRGKKLLQQSNPTTRPTTDRVRENVFNVLSNLIEIKDARVLDLFAGSGGYGLECYSRGAKEIVFCDADKQACEIIKKNCKAIGCDALVLNLDFRQALEKLKSKQFDIVFLDPPYESDFALEALGIITEQRMLFEDGIIIIESEKELQIRASRIKTYGRARLYFVALNLQPPQ